MGRKRKKPDQGAERPRRGKRRSIRYEAVEVESREPRGPSRADSPPRIMLRLLTLDEALERLEQAARQYARTGTRELVVVHGRGKRSAGGVPVLGPAVRAWCDEHPELVIRWREAPAAWGGPGAIVVTLPVD
jgi:DNA-nicking Smr family endonuclease